jgi:hypothetical protein
MVKAIPFAIISSPFAYRYCGDSGKPSPYFCSCEELCLSIESSHLKPTDGKYRQNSAGNFLTARFLRSPRTIQTGRFELARLSVLQETVAQLDARKIGVLACLFALINDSARAKSAAD